jgi:site-specific DNA-methyltransferase (adenine-specific)
MHDDFAKNGLNESEKRRDDIIIKATKHHLLERYSQPFSLTVANDALAFFADVAPWLPEITPDVLIGLARLRRDHPNDWQQRARAYFLPFARRMEPTWLDLEIQPHRAIQPAWMNKIHHGRFEPLAGLIDDHAIDLVVTSPPYGMQRKSDYGGIAVADYPAFTTTWMSEVKRVLKAAGSVMIIIRPHIFHGELSDYMLRTRLALRADGWIECDEWHWDKPDGPPLGHVERPRRSWESIHWFSLDSTPYIRAKAAGTPSKRLGFVNNKGAGKQFHHTESVVSSGIARPRDVLSVPVAKADRSLDNTHTAQFPVALIEPIIRMLCRRSGTVLDPFIGSGSTAIAAIRTGRRYVGFEKEARYAEAAELRIQRYRDTRR